MLAGLGATAPTAEADSEDLLRLGYSILNAHNSRGYYERDHRFRSRHDCDRSPTYYHRSPRYDYDDWKKEAKKRQKYYEKLEKERRKAAKEWRKKQEKYAKKYGRYHGSRCKR